MDSVLTSHALYHWIKACRPAAGKVKCATGSPTNPMATLEGSRAHTGLGSGSEDLKHPAVVGNGMPIVPARVRLDPEVDYLVGGGMLYLNGLWLHQGLNVFICRSCEACLTLDGLQGHRNAQHKDAISQADVDALQAAIKDDGICKGRSDMVLPFPGSPVIQGLQPAVPGFACRAQGCCYCMKDEGSMLKHNRKAHGGGPLATVTHRPCKVQTLFHGDLGTALDQLVSSVMNGGNVTPDATCTPDALLRVTGWEDFMPEARGQKKKREVLMALKDKHSPEELDGLLSRLSLTVNLHFEAGWVVLDRHGCRFTVLKTLIHGANIPSEWSAVSRRVDKHELMFGNNDSTEPNTGRRSHNLTKRIWPWYLSS
ncbi:hypothetical protein PAXRUDRAFT_18839 [Paxillus rubicundulus Ve08.2h10]|uniref:C2H2-type domain-containing protein n=1 Tax=Paxillus rubicundulus Ve08.2h10 TaxID=930991 RepID=A0A0D0D680_9AGAM|nr:hypothetical protein PAXRUDRAFT_18839 [Paxillus rubicundulus Ve08.2h10]